MKLPEDFYQRKNVVKIAQDLLGKGLFTSINGITTGGLIVETEAYSWKEKGCHAYGAKKTERNSIIFEKGGYSYVYLCYGMHHLFNIVTNVKGVADAVLVRALEPVTGIEEMHLRRGKLNHDYHLTSGPGKLTKALGIDRTFNGKFLLNNDVWIEDMGVEIPKRKVHASERIGIDYAGDDAKLPWRFTIKGNRWISQGQGLSSPLRKRITN